MGPRCLRRWLRTSRSSTLRRWPWSRSGPTNKWPARGQTAREVAQKLAEAAQKLAEAGQNGGPGRFEGGRRESLKEARAAKVLPAKVPAAKWMTPPAVPRSRRVAVDAW